MPCLLVSSIGRRGTGEIQYHDIQKGASYKTKTGDATHDDKYRIMLDNLYRSDTEKLSRLLNDEQYLWKGSGNDSGILWEILRHSRKTEDTFSYQRIKTSKSS